MKVHNGLGYLALVALALFALYRLYTVQASFSWILLILYIVVAAWLLVFNLVRYLYRRVTPDRSDDHELTVVTRVWNTVAWLSTAYGVAASAICYYVRHDNGLVTLYVIATLASLVLGVGTGFAVSRARRRLATV